MTERELIQLLKTARNVRDEYDQDYERIIRLRSLMAKTTTSYSANPSGGTAGDKLATQYCALEELEEHCRERQAAFMTALKQAMDLIELADTTEQRKVLKARYVDGKKWDDIAALVSYSNIHCHRLHDTALKSIVQKL